MSIRVVVADNQEIIRSGIAVILSAQPDIDVIADVADGPSAVQAVLDLHPDVAVLDVRMPTAEDGIDAARRIAGDETTAAVGRTVAVLMLTEFHVSEAVHAAIRAGATGFVLKDALSTELASAVRAVAAGDAWLAPAVTKDLLLDLHDGRCHDRAAGPAAVPDDTTPRELQVLELIAHGLSNDEIADHLDVRVGTVKTYVNRVFQKLQVRDRAQAVAWAYRRRVVGLDDPLPRPSPRRR